MLNNILTLTLLKVLISIPNISFNNLTTFKDNTNFCMTSIPTYCSGALAPKLLPTNKITQTLLFPYSLSLSN